MLVNYMAEPTRFETTRPAPDRVMIVEDEENARIGYEALLRRWGHEVLGVGSAEDALARFTEFSPTVLIADVELPGMNGLDLLAKLGDELKTVPAIIITGKGSEERIIAAIEAGAFWYIEKPLKAAVLRSLLDRAMGRVRDRRQVEALTRQLRETGRLGDLIGGSKNMQDVMRILEQVSPSSASVLITGETGSGKEILARTIHRLSPRAERPFIAINCSAIPESLMESEIFGHERGAFTGAAERRIGCFELADGGTLLLDEIGEMPAPTQAKLLRVLEDHKVRRLGSKVETPVDVRVLAATNKEPEQAVATGVLRQDLYFRLNVFHIHLPPLRERKDDIPLLVRHFLDKLTAADDRQPAAERDLTVSQEGMRRLMAYHWPGNVRQLENAIERAVAFAAGRGQIDVGDLPPEIQEARDGSLSAAVASGVSLPEDGMNLDLFIAGIERDLIHRSLERTGGNKGEAARLLGLKRTTLVEKLKRLEKR